ncbi:hypothetical protein [Flagellimonas myxillae]|uniref:hypothetical protein n=1 Tax=Flagellimonas myxillae TaxID=2942214 RepID=UPI00201F617F|nr:hypothetical protein [Muricauda myxillae]MCL6265412.1 hypothetical protein [Muricauda myxillae]
MRVRYQTAPHPVIDLRSTIFNKQYPISNAPTAIKQSGYQTEFIPSMTEGPHPVIDLRSTIFNKQYPIS